MSAKPRWTIDLARTEEPEGVTDAWTVFVATEPESVLGRLHRVEESKGFVVVPQVEALGADPFDVGDKKLPAIREMRERVAKLLGLPVEQPKKPRPAPKSQMPAEPTTEDAVRARIAQLEQEIADAKGKPEFAKMARARKTQITKLRKALPTSAAHAA